MGKWKTKDGRLLALVDMTTSHICNCVIMLELYCTKAFLLSDEMEGYAMSAPDGAADAADREAGIIMDTIGNAERWVIFFRMELEKRRKAPHTFGDGW